MSSDLISITCHRLPSGRWQANVRGKDRGWTCGQEAHADPLDAIRHAMSFYVPLTPPQLDPMGDLF